MHIKPISLDSTKKDRARILLAQPKWKSSQLKRDAKQIYQLTLESEDIHFIDLILQTGTDRNLDLIVFPEFSIPESLHSKIQEWTSKNNIIVVAGSTYLERNGKYYNTASLFYHGKKYLTEKIKLSPHEVSKIIGLGPTTGEMQYYFTNTPVGNLAIMICADEFESNVRDSFLKEEIDILCVIAVQSKSKEHYQSIDRIVKEYDKGIYVAYCNTLCDGFANGGTAFFGNDYPDTFTDSKSAGLTTNDGIDKKIIELQSIPGCLIVECDLGQKVVTYPNSDSWRSLMKMELPFKFENNELIQFFPTETSEKQPINKSSHNLIPAPPELYTKPRYLVSQKFVGRNAELDVLNDWAKAVNPYSILLFEAMGGTGKSMLTWEWVNNHAREIRKDWKGIFWYSFYEKGAVMADFCQHALAYITGQDLDDFRKMKTPELVDLLIPELGDGAWLIILDGLERVLESYNSNRFAEDAPEISTDNPETENKKDPCACINDEDDELLLKLSAAAPSKILASSRLIPRKLLNVSGQPIPGVQRYQLPGLRPADAEAMFRNCGVNGDADAIQNYLATNCDCHPLTIGVLAGLVNNYMRDKGNFDRWINDPVGGRSLNLAKLDLKGKQNHILEVAMSMLTPKSRQLLSTMALIYEAVDYDTLAAFNPYMPFVPDQVPEPRKPASDWKWERLPKEEKEWRQKRYKEDLITWKKYEQVMGGLKSSTAYQKAPEELEKTVRDLEQRGLLQYDRQTKRYELHPVVRFVSSGRLNIKETKQYGQKVVDYFSSKTHIPYKDAKTLEDLSDGIHVVRTLIRMGHYQQAFDTYSGELADSLTYNLEAHNEDLLLILPFFPSGWTTWPIGLNEESRTKLAAYAASALCNANKDNDAYTIYELLIITYSETNNWYRLHEALLNIARILCNRNNYAAMVRIRDFTLTLSELGGEKSSQFCSHLDMYDALSRFGRWVEADEMWRLLDLIDRNWNYNKYRPGNAEKYYAISHFRRGDLQEDTINNALLISKQAINRFAIRVLYWLKGMWYIEKGDWLSAVDNLNEAIRLARSISLPDTDSETLMAIAKFHLGQLSEPNLEAERLASMKEPAHLELAELWFVIGNQEQAKKHALDAYNEAWASGEPYVDRYNLNKAAGFLNKIHAEIPKLPPYDPDKDVKFPWEEKVEAFIERLSAEKNNKK
jgi:predicted amidohydrolase